MKLEKIAVDDARKLKVAEYQRDTRTSKVKGLYNFFKDRGFYDAMPILLDGENNVVDGGHRVKAYIKAFDDGFVSDGIFALKNNKANKDTFLNVNKGTPVSLNHKVKIHKITRVIESFGISISSKTSKHSISYVDIARALTIVYRQRNNKKLKQSSQDEVFESLEYFYGRDDLVDVLNRIVLIKNKYFDSLSKFTNRKYLQKLFLYLVAYSFKNQDIEQNIFDKIVNNFPMSLGGDIALAYNKSLFVSAFNFNLKKENNKITIEDF